MAEAFDEDARSVSSSPAKAALNWPPLANLDQWPAPGSSQVVIGPGVAPVQSRG